jgi:hypothetical protein
MQLSPIIDYSSILYSIVDKNTNDEGHKGSIKYNDILNKLNSAEINVETGQVRNIVQILYHSDAIVLSPIGLIDTFVNLYKSNYAFKERVDQVIAAKK